MFVNKFIPPGCTLRLAFICSENVIVTTLLLFCIVFVRHCLSLLLLLLRLLFKVAIFIIILATTAVSHSILVFVIHWLIFELLVNFLVLGQVGLEDLFELFCDSLFGLSHIISALERDHIGGDTVFGHSLSLLRAQTREHSVDLLLLFTTVAT